MAEEQGFAQARARLDEIVTQVRKKDTSLEQSLDLLEEGVRLANQCTELVDHSDWRPSGAAVEAEAEVEADAGAGAAVVAEAEAGVAVQAESGADRASSADDASETGPAEDQIDAGAGTNAADSSLVHRRTSGTTTTTTSSPTRTSAKGYHHSW